MNVPAPVLLLIAAAVCWNIVLLLTLAGIATLEDQTRATKTWAFFIVLTAFFGSNGYILDQLGKYQGW